MDDDQLFVHIGNLRERIARLEAALREIAERIDRPTEMSDYWRGILEANEFTAKIARRALEDSNV